MRTTALLTFMLAAAACTPRPAPGDGGPAPLVSSLQVRPGDGEVELTLQVTNPSDQPVELTFPTGQSFDFVVQRDGRELWRWSADRMFTQAMRSTTLAPGETVTHQATWHPPADLRGELVARGMLAVAGDRVEQGAVFRLP